MQNLRKNEQNNVQNISQALHTHFKTKNDTHKNIKRDRTQHRHDNTNKQRNTMRTIEQTKTKKENNEIRKSKQKYNKDRQKYIHTTIST